jgi:SpoVK/Ycf46/Vps4 family AAA+-type ATPase
MSDDKASVNELLIQIDRVLRRGRMLAATTNFIGSRDEALTQSGRFGRFIPVAPPDLDEAAEIVMFYLNALAGAPGSDCMASVRLQDGSRVRVVLEPLFARGLAERRFFCGADLEAAVNDEYVRSVRAAIPADGWLQGSSEDVVLTEEVLAESLAAGPRSVHPDSVERFLADVQRDCSRGVAAWIRARLSPGIAIGPNGQPEESKRFLRVRRSLRRPVAGLRSKRSPQRG